MINREFIYYISKMLWKIVKFNILFDEIMDYETYVNKIIQKNVLLSFFLLPYFSYLPL